MTKAENFITTQCNHGYKNDIEMCSKHSEVKTEVVKKDEYNEILFILENLLTKQIIVVRSYKMKIKYHALLT